MSGLQSADIRHCEMAVLGRNSPLNVSLAFTSGDLRSPLIAIHALFADIRSITLTVSDPSVAHAKLNWWLESLGRMGEMPAHPVLNALQQLGILESLQQEILPEYVHEVARFSCLDGVSDISEVFDAAHAIGTLEARLEQELDRQSNDNPCCSPGSSAFVLRLLVNVQARICGQVWWVPLSPVSYTHLRAHET